MIKPKKGLFQSKAIQTKAGHSNTSSDVPHPVSYTHLDVYKRQGYNNKIIYKK